MQGAARDQCNIMETNKTQSFLTKTIKTPYNFKIPLFTHTTVRHDREMAKKKENETKLLDCLNKN